MYAVYLIAQSHTNGPPGGKIPFLTHKFVQYIKNCKKLKKSKSKKKI